MHQLPFGLAVDLGPRVRAIMAGGSAADLVAELGDNYAGYHELLRERLARLDRRPRPADFHEDFAGYQEANQAVNEVLMTERLLRLCVLRRRGDDDASAAFQVPLVDGEERLYDFTQGPPGDGPPRPAVPADVGPSPTGMAAPPPARHR